MDVVTVGGRRGQSVMSLSMGNPPCNAAESLVGICLKESLLNST